MVVLTLDFFFLFFFDACFGTEAHGSQKDPPQSTHNALQECKLGNLLSKLFLTDICDKKSPGLWILNANTTFTFLEYSFFYKKA